MRTEEKVVYFNFALERGFTFTMGSYSIKNSFVVAVDSITVQLSDLSNLRRIQIHVKEICNFPISRIIKVFLSNDTWSHSIDRAEIS
jgi:hypothetical protein